MVATSLLHVVNSNANRDNFNAPIRTASSQVKFAMERIIVVTILMKSTVINLCASTNNSNAVRRPIKTHFVLITHWDVSWNLVECVCVRWPILLPFASGDGVMHCPKGDDEAGCIELECPRDKFKCQDGKCIPWVWVCDGDNDCAGNHDEENCHKRNCSENEFR